MWSMKGGHSIGLKKFVLCLFVLCFPEALSLTL